MTLEMPDDVDLTPPKKEKVFNPCKAGMDEYCSKETETEVCMCPCHSIGNTKEEIDESGEWHEFGEEEAEGEGLEEDEDVEDQ